MKTMLELLIRLQEMRCCCERARRNPQLTSREKAVPHAHKQIVRECLPPEVLAHYDRMKKGERAMLRCPEIFAMAVLVSTWCSLSPAGRRKLVAHFAPPPPVVSRKIVRPTRLAPVVRHSAGRCKTVDGHAVNEPRLR